MLGKRHVNAVTSHGGRIKQTTLPVAVGPVQCSVKLTIKQFAYHCIGRLLNNCKKVILQGFCSLKTWMTMWNSCDKRKSKWLGGNNIGTLHNITRSSIIESFQTIWKLNVLIKPLSDIRNNTSSFYSLSLNWWANNALNHLPWWLEMEAI